MSQFYCREDELRKLNKRYAGDKFECIVIYGRRRVGKTALINEFCKDKPTIFFSALNTTGKENLEALSKSIMSFERPDMESAPEFRSYDAALDELTALSKEKRIVFVIDEYPYLAKAKPAISAMLQHIIDHKWTESKMYLILCGSSMSFMESQVLGKESPLYGRRTGQFKIEPLDYKETAVFHPNLSAEDNSLIYGITGGVPHYINKLDVRDSVDEALLDNFFDRSSYLYEEPGNLLKQELREPAIYNAIIKAIAEGILTVWPWTDHLPSDVFWYILIHQDILMFHRSVSDSAAPLQLRSSTCQTKDTMFRQIPGKLVSASSMQAYRTD